MCVYISMRLCAKLNNAQETNDKKNYRPII